MSNFRFFLVTVLVLFNYGQAQIGEEPPLDFDCNVEAVDNNFQIPDITTPLVAGGGEVFGHEANIELNIVTALDKSGKSRFIVETHDFATQSGELELRTDEKDHLSEKVTYFLNNGKVREAFVVKGFTCQTKTEELVMDSYDKSEWLPTAMVNNEKWNGKNSVIKYYFADRSVSVGQFPLRVEVNTEGDVDHRTLVYSVGAFQQHYTAPQFSIPVGLGCQRMDGTKPESLPELFYDEQAQNYKDLRMIMEVVMETVTNGKLDDSSTASIFNAEIVSLAASNMISFTQSRMNLNKMEEGSQNDDFRFQTRKVMDLNEGLVYETRLDTSKCEIKDLYQDGVNEAEVFKLSDGSSFQILDKALWMTGDFLQYLGKGVERGVPTDIYEAMHEDKYKDAQGEDRTVIITRHYLAGDVKYDSIYMAKGAPIRTVITVYDKERTSFERVITLNIHSFESAVLDNNKQQAFDITNCFDEPHQSTWFQMQYPMETLTEMELLEATPKIEAAFRTTMNDLGPSRLPKVIVDYDSNFVTITARLLERPLYTVTYNKKENVIIDLKKADDTVTEPILTATPNECARKCEVDPTCVAFSWCDSLECVQFQVTQEEGQQVPTKTGIEATGCNTYEQRSRNAEKQSDKWIRMVNSAILSEIRMNIADHGLKLDIPIKTAEDKEETRSVAPVLLVTDVKPGWLTKELLRPKNDLSNVLDGFKQRTAQAKLLHNDENDNPRQQFKRSLGVDVSMCASLCKENDDFQAFSYCTTNDGECVQSTLAASDIKDDMMLTESTYCNIFQKTVMSGFEIYPVLSLSTKARKTTNAQEVDDCARDCKNEKDFQCKSFDYCIGDIGKDGSVSDTCLLHEFHVSAMANERRTEKTKGVDVKNLVNKADCIHYSRKYSEDFKIYKKQKFTDGVAVTKIDDISNEECAHQCSELAGADCQAYDYCETIENKVLTRSCRVTGVRNSIDQSIDSKDDNCNMYAKSTINDEPLKQGLWHKKFASPALATCMALLFLAVGAGCGAALYRYKYARNTTA